MTAKIEPKAAWTTKGLLEWTTEYLSQAHIDQPRLCAEILLAHVLQCQRIELYIKFDYCPTQPELSEFRDLVKRAAAHEPVQYLTGVAHFYGLDIQVSPTVLIPRPETELLVSHAIDYCRREVLRPTIDVLDLCTGSGCVGLALAANVIEADIVAADISTDALEIARTNLEKHDLAERIILLQSDLFAQLDKGPKTLFDLIVANPPYVSAAEFEKLEPHIRDYEPESALRAGDDGLDIIRRIITGAESFLADEGALMLEIAYNQADLVIALCREVGYLKDITAVVDQLGHKRIIKARKT